MNSCSLCRYFDPVTRFCRRFPPAAMVGKEHGVKSYYPTVVRPNQDCCGEFQPGTPIVNAPVTESNNRNELILG